MFATNRIIPNHSFIGRCFSSLKRTALFDFHLQQKGKMVGFCGWELPIQYESGTLTEHLHTRAKAGLFDVSHMGQIVYTGKDRIDFLEQVIVGDLKALPEGNSFLSLMTTENGGIVDDTVISKYPDHIYQVVNAGCFEKDMQHIQKHLSSFKSKRNDVDLEIIDQSLLALQGPKASSVLAELVVGENPNWWTKMNFMTSKLMKMKGSGSNILNVRITRCGYTGEDGFEISVPHHQAVELANVICSHPDVKPIGLGARDSLRLEAGLCLYGNDIDETTSPIEAALGWTIGKRRKSDGGFLGSNKVLEHVKNGVSKRRVGLLLEKGIARSGAKVFNTEEKPIGLVTSGSHSPMLKQGICMAYIDTPFDKKGTDVFIEVRGKMLKAQVSLMPFFPTNYFRVQ